MNTYFKIFFILTAVLIIMPLSAQSSAEIVYAEGDGFSLVRDGVSEYHDVYMDPVEGLVLHAGDLVLTEADTWLEIQLAGSGTIIKVAENTTFTMKTLQNEGGTFEVAYGRVRARVEKLTNDTPFWIGGSDTVAGVRGTDFGYDLFYDSASPEKKSVKVYCFEGEVEVVRQLETGDDESFEADADFAKGKGKTSSVILRKNEMVSVSSDDKTAPLNKDRLEVEIKEFWEVNEFMYEPETAELEETAFEIFHNDVVLLRKGALWTSLTGALMTGGGAALYLLTDAQDYGVGLMSVGTAAILSGGYLYIRSLILQ